MSFVPGSAHKRSKSEGENDKCRSIAKVQNTTGSGDAPIGLESTFLLGARENEEIVASRRKYSAEEIHGKVMDAGIPQPKPLVYAEAEVETVIPSPESAKVQHPEHPAYQNLSESSEDELSREQRLSALRIVSESDSFMDQLRRATSEIRDLAITPGAVSTEEKLECQIRTSDENSVVLMDGYRDLESSESSDSFSGTGHTSPSSRPSAETSSEKKSPCRESDLSSWVASGVWMTGDEKDGNRNDPPPIYEHQDESSPLREPNITAGAGENPTVLASGDTEMQKSQTDTEIYMTGAPQEFTVETQEEYEERMKLVNSSSTSSFASFSQEVLAFVQPEGTEEQDGKGSTDETNCSEHLSPRSDESFSLCNNQNFPSTATDRAVEKIYLTEAYDGQDMAPCTEAKLLWVNSNYWKDNQMTVSNADDEENNDRQDQPNPETIEFIKNIKDGKVIPVDYSPSRNGGDDLSLGGSNRDLESSNINGITSDTESTYDHTYLGRTSVFRPTLTSDERRMLGIHSPPESQEFDNSQRSTTEPRGVLRELLSPAASSKRSWTLDSESSSSSSTIPLNPALTFSKVLNTKFREKNSRSHHDHESGDVPDARNDFEDTDSIGSSIIRLVEESEESEPMSRGKILPSTSKRKPSPALVRSVCLTPNKYIHGFKLSETLRTMPTLAKNDAHPPILKKSPTKRPDSTMPKLTEKDAQPPISKKSSKKRPDSTATAISDTKLRNAWQKVQDFYENKDDLKKELNRKIKLLEKDAKLSSKALKEAAKREREEQKEIYRDQLRKIKNEALAKAYHTKNDYKLNEAVAKQDKWMGAIRSLLDKQIYKRELRMLKVDQELVQLKMKAKEKKTQILDKARKKAEKSEKKFKKKWDALTKEMGKSTVAADNVAYVPDDDLLYERLEKAKNLDSDSESDALSLCLSELNETNTTTIT